MFQDKATVNVAPPQEQELTYAEREAQLEIGDGEVRLFVDDDTEKAGAHQEMFKMASDGKVIILVALCFVAFGLHANIFNRQFLFLNHLTTPTTLSIGPRGRNICVWCWLLSVGVMLILALVLEFPGCC